MDRHRVNYAVATALPPDFAYWRDFAGQFVTALCMSAEPLTTETAVNTSAVPPPTPMALAALVDAAPSMPAGEYLTAKVLCALWRQTEAAFHAEHSIAKQPLLEYLQQERNPAWHLVGRVNLWPLRRLRLSEEALHTRFVVQATRGQNI